MILPSFAGKLGGRNIIERMHMKDTDSVIVDCLLSGFKERQIEQLLTPAYGNELKHYDPLEEPLRILREKKSLDPVSRARYLDFKYFLGEGILTKVDRASMAVSLEVRSPLLDHVFIDKLSKVPANMLVKGLQGKYLFKKAMEPYVPKENLYRPKQGFAVPLDKWSNPEAFVTNISTTKSVFINPKTLLDNLDARTTPRYPFQIQGCIFLEKWAQKWL